MFASLSSGCLPLKGLTDIPCIRASYCQSAPASETPEEERTNIKKSWGFDFGAEMEETIRIRFHSSFSPLSFSLIVIIFQVFFLPVLPHGNSSLMVHLYS